MRAPAAASRFDCPCGRGELYEACCGPLHEGAPAPTAERLMRSRYCAFALELPHYLRDTWHPSTRPESFELDPGTVWKWLVVESAEAGGPFDQTGTVTFSVISRTNNARHVQRELSRFVRASNRWVYLDGVALEPVF